MSNASVFSGFFQNPDYSYSTCFLAADPYGQTKITQRAQVISEEIQGDDTLARVINLLLWIKHNLTKTERDSFDRSAHNILKSKQVAGCADCALVFVTLARAMNIPAIFVQTANIMWIKRVQKGINPYSVTGHAFAEFYCKGKWLLADPAKGAIVFTHDTDDQILMGTQVVFAKSLGVWETGIGDQLSNSRTMVSLFRNWKPPHPLLP
jgi:transglutaminase-like putative cysteine protease